MGSSNVTSVATLRTNQLQLPLQICSTKQNYDDNFFLFHAASCWRKLVNELRPRYAILHESIVSP